MVNLIVMISFIIKGLAIIVLLSAFKVLASSDKKHAGFLTKYYLMRKKFDLLRASLLFVAGIIVLEIVNMVYLQFSATKTFNEAFLIASDALFVGLGLLLARIYKLKRLSDTELEYLAK
jgi:hypothetical protein